MNLSLPELLARGAALRADGRRAMACLVTRARGSTPQAAGALMLVDDAAQTWGTIGGGCVEAEVRREAVHRLETGEATLLRLKLDHDYGWDDGLICGGTLDVVVAPLPDAETLRTIAARIADRATAMLTLECTDDDGPARFELVVPPNPRLLIAGAGHVGQALARLALRLDFAVTVFDDRAELLARFLPDGAGFVDGPIADGLRAAAIDPHTACVVVTRGHRHDAQALHAVVGRGAGYVGMIGSRRKVKVIFDDLRERGVPDADLAPVQAPIGLDIGAVTVEEIAVSIAAQLVEFRSALGRPTVARTAVAARS